MKIKYKWQILSGICILACLTLFTGSAYAWYELTFSKEASTIKTASYSVSVSASAEALAQPYMLEPQTVSIEFMEEAENYKLELEAGYRYTIDLKEKGTASSGYILIGITGTESEHSKYYVNQLDGAKESQVYVVINAYEAGTLTITPSWGKSVSDAEKIQEDEYHITWGVMPESTPIPTPTPEPTPIPTPTPEPTPTPTPEPTPASSME